MKTIPFTVAHTYKAHGEVERETDFSPVFPNLPDASQKSIITVLKQAKPGSLYLVMSVKISCCQYSSQSVDIAIS